jgi:hypothetical protein
MTRKRDNIEEEEEEVGAGKKYETLFKSLFYATSIKPSLGKGDYFVLLLV